MALKAILDSVDDLDEGVAKLYTQQNDGPAKGKFLLNVESVGGFGLENVSGLKSSLSKERADRESFEKKLKSFEGLDPEAARDALKRLEDGGGEGDKDAKTQERIDAIRKQMETAHQKALSERDAKIAEMGGQLNSAALAAAKVSALDKHGAIPERRPVIEAYLDRFLKVEEVNGKREIKVVDQDGNPQIANDGSNMDVTRFVEGLRNDEAFAPFFKGTEASGGGSSSKNASPGGKTISRGEFDGITDPAKKAEIARTHKIT